MDIPSRLKTTGFTLAGGLILLGVAYYNGYPLLYSDTGTYLASGFELQTPIDRPINYGIFLRLTSLNGLSLWLTALSQCLIISYLLLLTFRDFTRLKNPRLTGLGIMALLTVLSGVGFVSGQIITDVFPAVTILAIWHLLFNDRLQKGEVILLFVLYTLANSTHFSHLLFNTLLLAGFLLTRNWYPFLSAFQKKRLVKRSALLLLLTWLSILTMGASLSKSKHAFFMARMAESGLLQDYLTEACPTHEYLLCQYKEQIPRNANLFLWDRQSPLYQYGSWAGSKNEFSEIIWQTLITPKYLLRHLLEAGRNSLKQLSRFDVGDGNFVYTEGSQLYERIQLYFPGEAKAYLHSRQSKGELLPNRLEGLNHLFKAALVASLLGLALIFLIPRLREVLPLTIRTLIYYLLTVVLLNAALNATLVTVADRFGAKVAWLIPLAFILALSQFRRIEKEPVLGGVGA